MTTFCYDIDLGKFTAFYNNVMHDADNLWLASDRYFTSRNRLHELNKEFTVEEITARFADVIKMVENIKKEIKINAIKTAGTCYDGKTTD